ncbi:unnamed protein product [Alopecurus aequalis]
MAGVTTNAVALVALLSMLVPSVRCAVDYSTSATRSYTSGWLSAKATWYGQPYGARPDDNSGACGFKNVNQYPLFGMTSCGNEPLFQGGAGCGTCYQIRCLRSNHPACCGQTKTDQIHECFDKKDHLPLKLPKFRRVPCNFRGLKVNFYVLPGANPNYLPVLVQYANRDGIVVKMDVKRPTTGRWEPMYRSWGSVWRLDTSDALQGPLSLRITSESGKTLVANNAIPAGWRGGSSYPSNIQFQ